MNDTNKDNNLPMDLDLIQMVQQARMAHDSTAKPSEIAAVYWIETKRKAGDYPAPTARVGEWIIETDVQHVDTLWETVKQATEAGKLGYKSKVATASRTPKNPDQRVIIVMTYNAEDQADVERIKSALLDLGIPQDLLTFDQI